jgi:signal transduction histidine kinase
MRPVSFRIRSALIISAAFIVFLTAFFVLSYFAVSNSLIDRGDREVREQLQLILSHLNPTSSAEQSTDLALLYGTTGEAVLAIKIYDYVKNSTLSLTGPPNTVTVLNTVDFSRGITFASIVTDSIQYRCFRIANERFEVSAAMDTRVRTETESTMVSEFAVLLLIGSIASFGIGYLVAGYSLRPFHRLLMAARRIEAEPLPSQTRLPMSTRVSEIAELSGAMNAILNTRDASISKLSAFTADVSHELRTPLTTMKGELEVELKLLPENEEQRTVLQSLLEEVERLIAIVEDLLLLSEIEQEGQVDAGKTPTCELHSVLRSVVDRIRGLASEKQLTLTVENTIASEVELGISCVRLERMLFNVLLNAINFTSGGGSVSFKASNSNGVVTLKVTDTGKGIAEADLIHIFDRFWRAEYSRSRSFGGAGLGLAIAKSIADRYGIIIDIASIVNQGTTVRFELPSNLLLTR